MKKIVVATKNKGKIREMANAFDGLAIDLLPLDYFAEIPDAVENGDTFEKNAVIKATYYMKITGCACLADDSGLETEALNGAPGVYSARFAGYHADDEANNKKLLMELAKVGKVSSPAAYRCVLAFVDTDGKTIVTDGSCEGTIRENPRGNGGFGYDPYFYISDTRTMAELTFAEKNKISHRGQALRKMMKKLVDYLAEK